MIPEKPKVKKLGEANMSANASKAKSYKHATNKKRQQTDNAYG